MNELYLEDGDPKFLFSYLITEGERKMAGIYASKEPIDGHWLVKAHKLYANGSMLSEFEVIGVTSHEENIPNKTYEKALEYGQQIAKGKGLKLSDKTKIAKSRLEQLAQSDFQSSAQKATEEACKKANEETDLSFDGIVGNFGEPLAKS